MEHTRELWLEELEAENVLLRKAVELLDGPFPIPKDAKDDDTCFLPAKAYTVAELREINRIYFKSLEGADNTEKLYIYFKKELNTTKAISWPRHHAYEKIMALGRPVVPFILRDLEKSFEKEENFPGWWFHQILPELTKEGIPEAEDSADGARWWVEWGKRKGLI